MKVIDLPERKDYRELLDISKNLRDHQENLGRLVTTYFKIVNQTAALTADYQYALQNYAKKVGVRNVPNELMEFAWILLDPDTGEIVYIKTEPESDPFSI
jgi:isopenicillin N synthase-like dioxygenase